MVVEWALLMFGREAELKVEPAVEERKVLREEPGRRYDPNAVFELELNSDESDEE